MGIAKIVQIYTNKYERPMFRKCELHFVSNTYIHIRQTIRYLRNAMRFSIQLKSQGQS